jgi:hypothetical protein
MAFATTAIRYGWVALTSLGVLTGVTIYVVNNTRQQVKPEDIIEIALGTYERCLATQTATNPTYSVTPPSFVRTWTSNVYTTNGVTVYTSIVTNTIGWHVDRDMMVSLDTTIKALVPYYVDTNTVYDGTTNIVMLTVTGLWASLGIGDKTNQFTRTPCWTNPISTNWVIDYTSYWPSTNGTVTNISYTSDYRQVVNYAQSWTATGGHVWVTSSNWDSSVVAVTNAATYGDYPWQIYVEDLQERYKVLNAMKVTKRTPGKTTVTVGERENLAGTTNYLTKYNETVGDSPSTNYATYNFNPPIILSFSAQWDGSSWAQGYIYNISFKWSELLISTQMSSTVSIYALPEIYDAGVGYTNRFDDNGYGFIPGIYKLLDLGNDSTNDYVMFDPPAKIPVSGSVPANASITTGFKLAGISMLVNWQFNYCTNKYW